MYNIIPGADMQCMQLAARPQLKGWFGEKKKTSRSPGRIVLLTVYYTVEIALTTSSQFMTFTQPHSDSR